MVLDGFDALHTHLANPSTTVRAAVSEHDHHQDGPDSAKKAGAVAMREAAARLCETRFQPRPRFGAATGAALLLEVLAVVAAEIRSLPLPGDDQ